MTPIPCGYCGVEFVPHQHNQRFCSARCKERSRLGVERHERTCPVCGKEFETYNSHDRYCSKECRLRYLKAVRARKRALDRGEEPVDIQVQLKRSPMVLKYAKVCEECGKHFAGKFETSRYCSEKCRNKVYDRNRNVKRRLEEYAAGVDAAVAEAQASWSSDYPDLGDDVYGNMVAL